MRIFRNVVVRQQLREEIRCFDFSKVGINGRIILGWDWRLEEFRTVFMNVIRMLVMGDIQGLIEMRVLICKKILNCMDLCFFMFFYRLRMEGSGGWGKNTLGLGRKEFRVIWLFKVCCDYLQFQYGLGVCRKCKFWGFYFRFSK